MKFNFLNLNESETEVILFGKLFAVVKPYLPVRDLKKVIHAFITSHLDYCSVLNVGLDQSSL